ncbi:hypothetical protein [Microtetraspora fusca]|uniref:hypothetical protein n=1 Tax=Microtetraspora fusca TaxID=1997 RepID=UPI00082E8410|nr:hypothetical protein [Microtetraspora fusca]
MIRRSVGTLPRKWLAAITLLAGLSAALAVAVAAPSPDWTFAALAGPVQSAMSVAVPFFGVLMVGDLRRAPRPVRAVPTLLGALSVAAVVGVFGALICAAMLAVSATDTAHAPWSHIGAIAAGGVLVQMTAQLVGTGLGLLLRPPVVAFLATVVLPMGLWAVLGAVEVLRPARGWLTPYPSVQNLLSGPMAPLMWAQWFAVLLIWGAGLNSLGVALLKRRNSDDNSPQIPANNSAH